MRKFILRNELGSVYNLYNARVSFLYKPAGLGYAKNVTAFHTVNGNYAVTKTNRLNLLFLVKSS